MDSQTSTSSQSDCDREKIREKLEPAYLSWKSDKKNLAIKSVETCNAIVEAFRKKNFNEELSVNERNWVNRYQCIRQNGVEVLQHNEKFLVKESNLFELLYDVHIDKGHAGRDLMFYELKKDFDGISKEVLSLFVKCCVKYELKKGKVKRSVTTNPILSEDHLLKLCLGVVRSDDADEDVEASGSDEVEGVEAADEAESKVTVTGTPLEADDSESTETADTEELRAEDASEAEDDTLTAINLIHQQKNTNIEIAKRGQKRQAEKMPESSAKRFIPLEVGQNVRVPVADVDRAKTDARNILGVILDKQDDFYKVGTKPGS
uniref:Uncharacterized protein n=1 Tax=Panagrolaimus davidi TaxID=227884 RepID=A0A914PUR4_9BILA